MIRQGDIQLILMHMFSELLIEQVLVIKHSDPEMSDYGVAARMIFDAYAKNSDECKEAIKSLNYDEVVELERELRRMAYRSIFLHKQYMEDLKND